MRYVKWFKNISKEDFPLIGEKSYRICELYNLRFSIPNGFIVTSEAHQDFLLENGIQKYLEKTLLDLNIQNKEETIKVSNELISLVMESKVPLQIEEEIKQTYKNMDIDLSLVNIPKETIQIIKAGRNLPYVAVRTSLKRKLSSTVNTCLNIKGYKELINAIKQSWAYIYSPEAITNLKKENLSNSELSASVIVQKMINSDKSAICFSESEKEMIIKAAYGLGNSVTSNPIVPNIYRIDKNSFVIKEREINNQEWLFTINEISGRTIKKKLSEEKAKSQVLDKDEIMRLVFLSKKIENIYKKPQEVEFAIENSGIYVLQTKDVKNNQVNPVKIMEETSVEENKEESLTEGLKIYLMKMTGNLGETKIIRYAAINEEEARERWNREYNENDKWKLDNVIHLKEVDGYKIRLDKIVQEKSIKQ